MLALLLACTPTDPAGVTAINTSPLTASDTTDTATDTDTPTDTAPLPADGPNVLLVIADDLGIEGSACYEGLIDSERAPQPTIEGLCSQGLVFDAAWANPMCSPTRAAMLTGRSAWRNGIGFRLDENDPPLSMDEVTLPEAIDAAGIGYSHANIGKWHLGSTRGADYPNRMGWGHFAGMLEGTPDTYTETWMKVVDGEEVASSGYLTTETIDDALGWVEAQDGPWVLWLALNAPHSPFHAPPEDLHDYDLSGDPEDDVFSHYLAMVQAMDTELGRLLSGIDAQTLANTYIIYVGDNGNSTIHAFSLDGEHLDWVPVGIASGSLTGIELDAEGRLYGIDTNAERIFRLEEIPQE